MKTLLKSLALLIFIFAARPVSAQVQVDVNVGTPPAWAPATPAGVEYYYLPDVGAYYDIRTTEYLYVRNGRWIRARRIPGYDPARGRTVLITDYHGRSPYVKYKIHKVKYHGKGHGKGKKHK